MRDSQDIVFPYEIKGIARVLHPQLTGFSPNT